MNLSEYLTEGILSKKTGLYNHSDIDKGQSFLSFLSSVEKVTKLTSKFFTRKPYADGYQPYANKTLDLYKLGKEINEIHSDATTGLRIDENGALIIYKPRQLEGYYIGFFGNGGTLSQIINFIMDHNGVVTIHKNYSGKVREDKGMEEFNKWLKNNFS